jgi:hypothetical protein
MVFAGADGEFARKPLLHAILARQPGEAATLRAL